MARASYATLYYDALEDIDRLTARVTELEKLLAWHTGNPPASGWYQVFTDELWVSHDFWGEGSWLHEDVQLWREIPALPEGIETPY